MAPMWEAAGIVRRAKEELGSELLILAHHYQRDEIVEAADFRGDSLELARRASEAQARWIVFCGVHFMAETAAILARPGQEVLIPREDAGCFLAHSVDGILLRDMWERISAVLNPDEILPVAYVNTTAEVKAFVGERGGVCCTSSSAETILSWALQRSPRVLFLPDWNLGYNVARRLGVPEREMASWDPQRPPADLGALRKARVILWKGACNVHVRFLAEDVVRVRRERPDARVIVHPECRPEVVEMADAVGSTSQIIRAVSSSPPGSSWAVGTEQRLVARLARENPDKEVFSLADPPPFCSYMSLTTLGDLARVLEGLLVGEKRGAVALPEEVARPARRALEAMFQVVG